MSEVHQYIIGAVLVVAILAVGVARLRIFQEDLRRSMSLGVATLGLFTTILSIHVLVTGLGLRASAIQNADPLMASQWNGLILGAIMLLLVSSLAFFFAIAAFIWSLIPPAPGDAAPKPASLNRFVGLEAPQNVNPLEHR